MVGSDDDGSVLAHVSFTLKNGARGGNTYDLLTVDDFEIAVRRIVIANEGAAIHPDRHRAVLAHIAGFVGSRCESRFRTRQIGTEGRFQIVIGRVVIADETLPSGNGDRGVLPDVPLCLQEG